MTCQDEDVPSEDVAMLRQVFALADSTGDGFINETELGQMHQVLGEPLSEAEVRAALRTRTRSLALTLTNANPHPHPHPHPHSNPNPNPNPNPTLTLTLTLTLT